MLRKLLLAFLASLFALCANGEAKPLSTTLRVEDHGVLGAMHRMHCNSQWLSLVMKRSGLLETELNTLPAGTPINLPDEYQTSVPPREVVRLTQKIFADLLAIQNARILESRNAAITNDLEVANAKITSLNRDITALKNLPPVTIPNISHERKKSFIEKWGWVYAVLLVGFCAGIFIWHVFIVRELKEKQRILEEKNRELSAALASGHQAPLILENYHGYRLDFPDTSQYLVGCPLCPERRISRNPRNARQHADTHTHLRLVRKTPEEMESLLNLVA